MGMAMSDVDEKLDREGLADWLARRYTSEELAGRILRLSGLRFSPRVRAHLADSLSACGSVALGRELARNVCSLDEFPDYVREVAPAAPGRSVRGSRGPSRYQLLRLLRASGARQEGGVGA